MKFTVFAGGALALAMMMTLNAAGQDKTPHLDTLISMSRAEMLVPRPALQPVRSIDPSSATAIDTLDTGNPAIKILLLENYTWRYYKDPSAVMQSQIFNEYWDEDKPNPYGAAGPAINEDISIWVVDSLSEYHCPYQTKVYSPFGYRRGRGHMGVDLPLPMGTPVKAAFSGKVRVSKYFRGYGNLVIIRHENGLETFYGHLSKRNVVPGDWVQAGDVIGLGGSTGRSTGAHLHFEVRYMGYAFDPQWLIDFETGILRHRLFILKKRYLNAASRYIPESDEEDYLIMRDDSIAYSARAAEIAAREAEEARKAAELAKAQYHKIKSGDTLGSLAVKNHTTVKAICNLNGITPKTTLRIGRSLRVR